MRIQIPPPSAQSLLNLLHQQKCARENIPVNANPGENVALPASNLSTHTHTHSIEYVQHMIRPFARMCVSECDIALDNTLDNAYACSRSEP